MTDYTEAYKLCMEWLRQVRKTKGRPSISSYRCKHIVETRECYVPNQVFIDAAIASGFRGEDYDVNSMLFNFNPTDIKNLEIAKDPSHPAHTMQQQGSGHTLWKRWLEKRLSRLEV